MISSVLQDDLSFQKSTAVCYYDLRNCRTKFLHMLMHEIFMYAYHHKDKDKLIIIVIILAADHVLLGTWEGGHTWQ
jgi:hypothetical protein